VGYEIEHKKFLNGDFGDLERFEFNNAELGGGVDFWSSGWLGIHLVDYATEEELMNFLLEPQEEDAQKERLRELLSLLNRRHS
jgi:hypothetical protein